MVKLQKLSGLDALGKLKTGTDGKLQVTDDPKEDKGKPVAPIATLPNLGWLYHKDYFKHVDWAKRNNKDYKPFEKKNQALTNYQYKSNMYALDNSIALHRFALQTAYPGIAFGTGVSHEAGIEGEYKLGFHFDHTTGLPVIPASSVKGVLRSLFKNTDAHEFLQELIEDEDIVGKKDVSITLLEKDIFEGVRDGKAISMCKRDIFFDAVLVSQSSPRKIMETDYITPHLNRKNPELSPFTNPVPIQFIKVRSAISFEFRFRLNNGLISAENKQALFKAILTTIGIGAKTNVGYGQFTEP